MRPTMALTSPPHRVSSRSLEACSSCAPCIKAAAGFSSSAALAARSLAQRLSGGFVVLRLTHPDTAFILAGHQSKTTGDLHQLVAATKKWLNSGNT